MILKKVIIDGKEVFEPISFEDALEYENHEDLLFSNEDEKNDFYDELGNVEEENDENHENKEDNNTNFNFNFSEIGDFFSSIFTKPNKNSKCGRLIATLPFLNDEDIHEIVEQILQNSEEYEDLNLIAVMPFLSKDDCDALFMKFVVEKENKHHKYIYGIAPFVSSECLSKFVDGYLEGKYQDINIDILYPFMSSADVKRVFNYIISKK